MTSGTTSFHGVLFLASEGDYDIHTPRPAQTDEGAPFGERVRTDREGRADILRPFHSAGRTLHLDVDL